MESGMHLLILLCSILFAFENKETWGPRHPITHKIGDRPRESKRIKPKQRHFAFSPLFEAPSPAFSQRRSNRQSTLLTQQALRGQSFVVPKTQHQQLSILADKQNSNNHGITRIHSIDDTIVCQSNPNPGCSDLPKEWVTMQWYVAVYVEVLRCATKENYSTSIRPAHDDTSNYKTMQLLLLILMDYCIIWIHRGRWSCCKNDESWFTDLF